jgi:hypothetical protein
MNYFSTFSKNLNYTVSCSPFIATALLLTALTSGTLFLYKTQKKVSALDSDVLRKMFVQRKNENEVKRDIVASKKR